MDLRRPSRGGTIRHSHRLILFGLLLLFTIAAAAVWSGAFDFNSTTPGRAVIKPGLTVVPEGPAKPAQPKEIAGSFQLFYSGPRATLEHTLESWVNGKQRLSSWGGLTVEGTGIKGTATIVFENVYENHAQMAEYREEDSLVLGPVENETTRKIVLPSKFRAIRSISAGYGGTHKSYVAAVPEDEDLPYHVVHSPREHVFFVVSSEPPEERFKEQPIVWGCFFNREEDQEWMKIFTKDSWSNQDFEHAASRSDRAVLLRIWPSVHSEDREELEDIESELPRE